MLDVVLSKVSICLRDTCRGLVVDVVVSKSFDTSKNSNFRDIEERLLRVSYNGTAVLVMLYCVEVWNTVALSHRHFFVCRYRVQHYVLGTRSSGPSIAPACARRKQHYSGNRHYFVC